MIDMVQMGEFFFRLREKYGYTQQEVSEFIDVCDKTIYNLEIGRKNTDFNTIIKLCDLYKIDLSELSKFYMRDDDMDYAIMLYINSAKGRRNKNLIGENKDNK